MREHPETASGSTRDVAALMRAVPGLLAKDGFEGVQVAALPDGRAVALKISDGADRARVPVAAAALEWAGVDGDALKGFTGAVLLGGGRPVGAVSAVPPLPAPGASG
jgi:L-asparaginase II